MEYGERQKEKDKLSATDCVNFCPTDHREMKVQVWIKPFKLAVKEIGEKNFKTNFRLEIPIDVNTSPKGFDMC